MSADFSELVPGSPSGMSGSSVLEVAGEALTVGAFNEYESLEFAATAVDVADACPGATEVTPAPSEKSSSSASGGRLDDNGIDEEVEIAFAGRVIISGRPGAVGSGALSRIRWYDSAISLRKNAPH